MSKSVPHGKVEIRLFRMISSKHDNGKKPVKTLSLQRTEKTRAVSVHTAEPARSGLFVSDPCPVAGCGRKQHGVG